MCSDLLAVDADFHAPHEPGCPGDGCICDLVTHPECCPTCVPVQIEGQLSIVDALVVS